MRSSRSALIISDNVQFTEELKHLLIKLDIPSVTEAISDKEALAKFFALLPSFTFLDLNSETIRAHSLAKVIQDSQTTKLSLLCKKNHSQEWQLGESEKVYFVKTPIIITKLNDIVNPHLSFSNLLDEAKAILKKEAGSHKFT